MIEAGFDILPGEHPIVPVMYGDATAAVAAAERLLELGLYVTAFSYPVVPHGKARIRTQLSAAHTTEDIDFSIDCFKTSRVATSRVAH
jgi:glycine C-acetyltransferase